ncbi:Hpt domain-containing protein [Mesonia aestuariivivens]|uniref:Hpt domain-containing protein n=1 Tax=Mesonia aestuariivivens TaxID=2796128 RepID=A0ABS6VY42_9FLAO|nr:hypothetical protein [Mesonia aestuariivivens]MBW2960502.1 hypothetical protein [Mesonia aestuariivivens]
MHDYKILLIEDTKSDILEFKTLAQKHNWKVEYFSNCFEAFNFLKSNLEDYWLVLVSSTTIPLNSVQIQNYIQNINDLQFSFVVTYIEPVTVEEYLENTFFVKKPFINAEKDLKNIVETIIKENNFNSFVKSNQSNIFNLSYLNEVASGNEDFIKKSLASFKYFVGERVQELISWKENLTDENIKKIKETAHQIKPSFQMLNNEIGADLAQELCYEVDANNKEEISNYVLRLKEQYDLILNQLNKEYPNL